MSRFFLILLLVFLSSFNVFSQEKYTKHIVSKGETISKIAKQYKVTSSAIYKLNPDAKKGIKSRSVLLIPTNTVLENKKMSSDIVTVLSKNTHTVLSKETLYGISKEYGVTIKDLYKANPNLEKTGLKKGQKIKIFASAVNSSVPEVSKETVVEDSLNKLETTIIVESGTNRELAIEKNRVHIVLQNETKYAIAKNYGIKIADLDNANPILQTEALKIDQRIIIPSQSESNSNTIAMTTVTIPEKPTSNVVKAIEPQPIVGNNMVEVDDVHMVLSKETKYGIAKKYGITVKELERQNPNIKRSLKKGQKLTIRILKEVEPVVVERVAENSNAGSSDGTELLDKLVFTASENLGTKYRYGGTTKDGIDCSGLMCNTYSAYGIQLPRTSIEQSQYGVVVNAEEAKKGDLIFFKTTRKNRISHVGMVIDVNDGDIKFIHASVSEGVIISSVKEKYYSKRVTQINRVL